jgi:hypothetical protein
MRILKTAIAAGRWDVAAHALVLATIKVINSGARDIGNIRKIRSRRIKAGNPQAE